VVLVAGDFHSVRNNWIINKGDPFADAAGLAESLAGFFI